MSIIVGQQLITARGNLGLSRLDIISILRVHEKILDTIDHDQYPSQTIDVFMKGHIVAYCKLLKINPQTILNQLESKGYDFPIPISSRTQPSTKKRKLPMVRIVISIAIMVIMWNIIPNAASDSREIAKPYMQNNYTE